MTHFSHYMGDEQEPFLREDRTDLLSQKPVKLKWILPCITILSVMVNGILLLLWMLPRTSLDSIPRDAQKSPILYSPFHGVIKQKIELWPQDAWDNSIYVGRPSRELDAAWDRLQAIEGISVTPEEADKINLTSKIFLKSGDQAVILGYFHNLHCIRYLYQGLHPDIYRRGQDPAHSGFGHSYHCLEVLRRSILCQPDLTLHSIHWQDEQKRGMDLEPDSTRECIDFNAIYDFSMTRRFPRDMIIDS